MITHGPDDQRDPTSEEQLLTRYEREVLACEPALYAWALSLTHAPWDAQDLVQETLERALRHFSSFVPGTNARSWLQRILFNLFIDRRRRGSHEQTHDPAGFDDLAAPEPEPRRPWEGLAIDDVRMALRSVDPRFRRVMEAQLNEGCSYRELARRFGIPAATVGTRLMRCREKLRVVLQAHEGSA